MHCGRSGSKIKPYAGRRLKKQRSESAEGLALFLQLTCQYVQVTMPGIDFGGDIGYKGYIRTIVADKLGEKVEDNNYRSISR